MRVRRAAIVDEYVEDGRVAIFVGETVLTLSELATTAWLVVGDEWMSADLVTQALVEEYGAPPPPAEAAESTYGVLRGLADSGVVEVDELTSGAADV